MNNEKIALRVYSPKNVSSISGAYWGSHQYGQVVERPDIFVYF
jgi:hypothetical protein